MILFDDGWTARQLADGIGLFPPGGLRDGSVRIRDRRRPLRTARAVIDRSIAQLGIGDARAEAIEHLQTIEGEHAAFATIVATIDGLPCERNLGLIFGDDFYTQIDAVTVVPSQFARLREAARELVCRYGIGLGHLRIRRAYYEPPPGWTGYPRGLATSWYPPGFPRNRTSITALPAVPSDQAPGLLTELNLRARLAASELPAAPYRALASGLEGLVATVDAGSLRNTVVCARDDRFDYSFQLESPIENHDRHRSTLDQVVASLQPVPRPQTRAAPSQVFFHWVG